MNFSLHPEGFAEVFTNHRVARAFLIFSTAVKTQKNHQHGWNVVSDCSSNVELRDVEGRGSCSCLTVVFQAIAIILFASVDSVLFQKANYH